MENFIKKYDVSRETYELLKTYEVSLNEWQKKFNLVSNASLEDAWNRHFVDSVQLFQYIPKTARTIVDFGSGAGFPAMVLAVMALEKTPYLNFKLIESVGKKTVYLNEVKEITGARAEIINKRIENIKGVRADVITSRAVTSLKDLFEYTITFFKKDTICIFPKGKRHMEEINDAKLGWNFDYDIKPSDTSEEGVILIIKNLSRKWSVK